MNIRRGFLALAAMILGVGFLGASPAQATPHYVPAAPCIEWNVASTTWPTADAGDTHFFICDGSYQNHMNPSSQAIAVRNQAQAQAAVIRTKMKSVHTDVFVWMSPETYNAYPHTASDALAPVGNGTYGITVHPMGPGHPTASINIFRRGCLACVDYPSLDLQRTLNHELGHALDIYHLKPSQGATYGNMLTVDFNDFDMVQNVNWSGLPGNCNSGSNSHKLKCWFQHDFPNGNLTLQKEFFAEEFAAGVNNSTIPPQAATILRSYFSTGNMPPANRVRSYSWVKTLVNTP